LKDGSLSQSCAGWQTQGSLPYKPNPMPRSGLLPVGFMIETARTSKRKYYFKVLAQWLKKIVWLVGVFALSEDAVNCLVTNLVLLE